jgi:hypothetical protein
LTGLPNGEGSDGLPNELSPPGFEKEDSPGLEVAKLENPPPPPPENELKPPPVDPPPAPRRLFPGVLGCAKLEAGVPKPDWPNAGCAGVPAVPNVAPGLEGVPKDGAGADGCPKAGPAGAPPIGDGLPKAGPDCLPKAVAPMVDGLPKEAPPAGLPKAEAPKGED